MTKLKIYKPKPKKYDTQQIGDMVTWFSPIPDKQWDTHRYVLFDCRFLGGLLTAEETMNAEEGSISPSETWTEQLMLDPDTVLHNLNISANIAKPEDIEETIYVRPVNIPFKKRIEEITSEDIGKLVAIDAIVDVVRQKKSSMETAHFVCRRCEFPTIITQNHIELIEPLVCSNENCKRALGQTAFDIDLKETVFVDVETITIEDDRNKSIAKEPYTLKVMMAGDLCQELIPGQHAVINCIIRAIHKKDNSFEVYGEAVSFENQDESFETLEISEDDEKSIREESQHPYLHERLRSMLAPQIKGNDRIKDGILLQMFGGHEKIYATQRERGDISILVVGDPGVGKSAMFSSVAKVSPRAIYSSGKGVSGVGLTAAMSKSEDSEWLVKPGVLVKADRGTAIIDEIEKMSEEDRKAIHEPMESGTVTIAKAGVYYVMNARCSVLAAANPKKGRFDQNMLIAEQINLDPALLSRFDLIFIMIDRVNIEKDEKLANEVLGNSIKLANALRGDDMAIESLDLPFSIDMFKKYVGYAKQNIHPILTEKGKKMLVAKYVSERKESNRVRLNEGVDRVSITMRQLEALRRLSEASARMHLRDEITEADVKLAIDIYQYSIDMIGRDADGKVDIDRLMCGKDRLGETTEQKILRVIEDQLKESGDNFVEDDLIINKCGEENIPHKKTREALKLMHRDGKIVMGMEGYYKLP